MRVVAPRFPELPFGHEWTGRPLILTEGTYLCYELHEEIREGYFISGLRALETEDRVMDTITILSVSVADKVVLRAPVKYASQSCLTEIMWYVEAGELLSISGAHAGTGSRRSVQVAFCVYYPRAMF